MGMFDPDEVITEVSIREAIEMGELAEVFKDRWSELSGGKPIVASANLYESVSEEELLEIWNKFVFWHKFIMPTRPENDKLFGTQAHHMPVWVIDDKICFTMLYATDY